MSSMMMVMLMMMCAIIHMHMCWLKSNEQCSAIELQKTNNNNNNKKNRSSIGFI